MKLKIFASLAAILQFGSSFAGAENPIPIKASGEVQPAAQFDVKSDVGGHVKKLHVRAGDRVRKGGLLAEIDPSPGEAPSKGRVLANGEGVVLRVNVAERQPITPASEAGGTVLVTIGSVSKLLVQTHVTAADAARLAPGQTVQATVEPARKEPAEGKISFIAPVSTVNDSVKGFEVQALIENPGSWLRPGMTVQLSFPGLPPAK